MLQASPPVSSPAVGVPMAPTDGAHTSPPAPETVHSPTASTEACPVVANATNIACTFSFVPVKCGEQGQCIYSNPCVSEAAGFSSEECVLVAPDCPAAGIRPCNETEQAVVCGAPETQQCEYTNQCYANSAGYSEDECFQGTLCPPPGDFQCIEINQPVDCNGQCNYKNLCFAVSAGFVPENCTLSVSSSSLAMDPSLYVISVASLTLIILIPLMQL